MCQVSGAPQSAPPWQVAMVIMLSLQVRNLRFPGKGRGPGHSARE